MTFYERLNDLCIKNGQNISRFSIEILGVSNATPTGWKKGSCPRSDVVVSAAKYFNVTTDYLLGLSDVPFPQCTINGEEEELLSLIRCASPEVRNAAINAVRAIVNSIEPSKNKATSCHSDEKSVCDKAAF